MSEATGKFSCPSCGKHFTWKAALAGKSGKCKCGNTFTVPMNAPVEEPEDLYDMALSLEIGELEHVGARGQRCARYLNRTAERQERLLIEFIRARARRCQCRHGQRATEHS